MLIMNQECMVKSELCDRLKMQKVVTIIIKERLLIRKSCKKHPVRGVLDFPWREIPIQDDWDAINLKDTVQWVAV